MSDPRALLAAVLCLVALAVPARCDWTYKLDKSTAGLSSIRVSGRDLVTSSAGPTGIRVQEVISEKGAAVTLPTGDRFSRQITTTTLGSALIVTIEITDSRKQGSAARVFYQVPLDPQWNWHGDLSNRGKSISGEQSQSIYPLSVATLSGTDAGLAVVMSPETPCVFSAGCSKDHGLYIEARVGFSPATNPPSRARVQFVVFPIDGAWGMRAALKEYYRLFPKSFERRTTKEGLWLFHGNAAGLPNPKDFTFHEIAELGEAQNTGKQASGLIKDNDLAKEKDWGIELYPYLIPGQREIAFLDQLKGESAETKLAAEGDRERELTGVHYTTAEAMKVLEDATAKNISTAMTGQSLADFKQTIRNSMLTGADGDVVTRPRIVPWAKKALTFPMNPNPFIQGHNAKLNAGSLVLEQARQSLSGPADGIYVDSLYRWGNYLDYSREHFAATRMGLTYGDDGRPCLDNALEHLTFLDELGKLLHPKGRKVFGNGVNMGRFWHAIALDISGSEMGNASVERYQFSRAAGFKKPYLALMHTMGTNQAKDLQFLAKCIAFGVYGSGDRDYYASPKYARTKAIYDTYLPIQRKMNKLGWEPITAATAANSAVLVERFGEGREVYFTLYDTTGKLKSADIDLDCARLGLAGDGIKAVDAATEKELKVQRVNGAIRVTGIPLTPQAFGVVRVTGKGTSQ